MNFNLVKILQRKRLKIEKFTIHHVGTEFIFEEGIIEDAVDFIVPLKLENIQNMMKHAEDGKIDASESWRILDVLFTPLTKVTLENPILLYASLFLMVFY